MPILFLFSLGGGSLLINSVSYSLLRNMFSASFAFSLIGYVCNRFNK
jgi:hypothetical protein